MISKMKKLWKRIRNWLIERLGGYTWEEYHSDLNRWCNWVEKLAAEADAAEERERNTLMGIKTATAEVEVKNYGPYEGFDKLKGRARKDIIKQLGEAVYPYAHHFIGEDVYIVSINVQEADYEDCP